MAADLPNDWIALLEFICNIGLCSDFPSGKSELFLCPKVETFRGLTFGKIYIAKETAHQKILRQRTAAEEMEWISWL